MTILSKKIICHNLSLYFTHCKYQGQEENKCCLLVGKIMSQGDHLGDEAWRNDALMQLGSEANNVQQVKGDERDFLC